MLLLVFESNCVKLCNMFYVRTNTDRFTNIGMFWRLVNSNREFSFFIMECFWGSTKTITKLICI